MSDHPDPERRDHRCRLARERAGLSIGQAAKLLGIDRAELERIEDPKREMIDRAPELASLYGVGADWLLGVGPLRDYVRIDAMRGAENLTPHDRDELAEFAASIRGATVKFVREPMVSIGDGDAPSRMQPFARGLMAQLIIDNSQPQSEWTGSSGTLVIDRRFPTVRIRQWYPAFGPLNESPSKRRRFWHCGGYYECSMLAFALRYLKFAFGRRRERIPRARVVR